MKKQVIAIHGGNTFPTYEEYIEHLKNYPLTLERLKGKKWRERLDELLGPDFEVLQPKMPNKDNCRYSEWKLWFEKIIPLVDDGVVLLGHSMGGIFLAKYLAENTVPKMVKATLLVAPPYNEADADYSLGDFVLPSILKGIEKQSPKTFLYFSKDDDQVPFADLAKYQKELPNATVRTFEDRGHFAQEDFPEIVEDIKAVFK